LIDYTLKSVTDADEVVVSNKVIELIGMLGVKGEAASANV